MEAKVQVVLEKSAPDIDPNIFGHFLENMGKSLYRGGLLAPDGSVRQDVLSPLKDLHVSNLRWPGGLFADGYHWTDGIGKDRPVRPNVFWRRLSPIMGPKDPNHFGTHEFLDLCETFGAEPYINVNLGTGTPEEAANWVRYCNAGERSSTGKRRAANGRAKPWGVKLWGIGNETFGWWASGHSGPSNYAEKYLRFTEAMRTEDKSIKPVAVGTCDLFPEWNPALLDKIGDDADYLSVHVYLPGNEPPFLFMRVGPGAQNHYTLAAAYLELDRKLKYVQKQIVASLGEKTKMRIALDEWNLWWWWPQAYSVRWRMRDAVSVAGMAGALVDNCREVTLANIAQAVNVLGLLHTNEKAVVKTPLYYVMQLFAEAVAGKRAECNVTVPGFSSQKIGGIPAANAVPFVSAHAGIDGDRFGMVLVQRRYEGPVRIELETPGVTIDRVKILSAEHPDVKNTMAEPNCAAVSEREIKDGKGGVTLELPAASVAAVFGTKNN
jgi:alpha-L-arabinofuranosidase